MPTPLTYQTNGMPVEEGFCVQVDANGYIPNISYLRKIYAKTASYTVKATESGAVFTTTGNTAALVFTLPAVASSAGMEFIFLNTVNQTMTVTAPSGTLVAKNSTGSTSIAYSTASKKTGQFVRVICDGAKWIVAEANYTDATIS